MQRTKDRIVLDDAAIARRFSRDPYFLRVHAHSVLCLPIRRGAEVVAFLYLENDMVPGAFSPERLLALELLAGQAAISLENARLLRETQSALQLREEFLSLASHELRTPLTSLRMMAEALLYAKASGRELQTETLERSYRQILRGVGRLEQLAAEMLDATLVERGDLSIGRGLVDLRALVHEVVGSLEPDLCAAGCIVTIDADEPVTGVWDRTRLKQVVSSLLSNAIKFGRGHAIEIHLSTPRDVARLVVEDHGSGIEAKCLARVFERFERGVPVQHYGGLGLGLYITHRIVDAHGGTIRAESTLGIGSRFIVELPRKRA